jgi:vacuolar-type H+-ATPase subunit E/Vma4
VVEHEVERLHEAAEARLHLLRTQAGREAGEELGGLLARSQKHGRKLQEQLAR